jgi:hypothetical protein
MSGAGVTPSNLEPLFEVFDFQTVHLARALHRLGVAIGADVGRPIDVLRNLETRRSARFKSGR